MQKLRMMVVFAAIMATLTVGVPAAAAKPTPSAPAGDVSIQAANGYFYIWNGTYRTGARCAWLGNDSWYGDTVQNGVNCNDMATSTLNNGFAEKYENVVLYKDVNYHGGLIVLCRGDYLQDMSLDHWSGGTNANNSASSHDWVADGLESGFQC